LISVLAAQDYPSRPVRIVVPFAPGGGVDTFARLIAQKLQDRFGSPFVVENRAGANATVGGAYVTKSAPDGYTWLFGTGQNTVNPSLMKKVPHDIVQDFAPVSLIFHASYMLAVHPAVPARSVSELIALARAEPGRLNYGSGAPRNAEGRGGARQRGHRADREYARGAACADRSRR